MKISKCILHYLKACLTDSLVMTATVRLGNLYSKKLSIEMIRYEVLMKW